MLQDRSIAQKTSVNEDWLGVFDEYDVRFLILDRHDDSNVLELFRSRSGWTIDFEDEEAVIFARADANQHRRTGDKECSSE